MTKLSYTIELTINEKGNWSLTVDGERYAQVRDGYWRNRVGTPMHEALVKMAEHWIKSEQGQ